MNTIPLLDRPLPELIDWFTKHDVDYEVHEHAAAMTARATARAEGVSPRTFAKVLVAAVDDERPILFVLDATDRLDLRKASRAVHAQRIRLLMESELATLAPACELGAMPAIGPLFQLPTYADHAVRDDPEISFNAGSHRFSARVDRGQWERACGVVYADLARERDIPAWARE